jgi:hypothetical protein
VVAWQDDHGLLQALQLLLDKLHGVFRNPIMIEEVASDEEEIHAGIAGTLDDGLQAVTIEGAVCLTLLGVAVAIAIKMNVGSMQNLQSMLAL